MMFWKKSTSTTSTVVIKDTASASSTSSVYSDDQDYFDESTQRPVPPSSPSSDSALVKALTKRVMELTNQCEEMEGMYEANKFTMKQLHAEVVSKEEECKELSGQAQECAELRESVRELDTRLERCEQSKKATVVSVLLCQTLKLKTEQRKANDAHTQLTNGRDQQIATQVKEINALRADNNVLASRVADADNKADKLNRLTSVLQQQHQTFSNVHAKQQQEHEALQEQVKAMQAQHQQDAERFQAQLLSKDNKIRGLAAQLRQVETITIKHDLRLEAQAAAYEDQLRRLTLDLDGAKADAEAWMEYANSKHSTEAN